MIKLYLPKYKYLNDFAPIRYYLKMRKRFENISFKRFYTARNKHELQNRIFRDFMEMAVDEVLKGNLVYLTSKKKASIYLSEKTGRDINRTVLQEMLLGDNMPYITLDTGKHRKDNKRYIIFIDKKRFSELEKEYNKGDMKITRLWQ